MSKWVMHKKGTKLWVVVEGQIACGIVEEDYDSRYDNYVDIETGLSWRTIFIERDVFKTQEELEKHHINKG